MNRSLFSSGQCFGVPPLISAFAKACAFCLVVGISGLVAEEGTQIVGLHEQITVKSAKELKIKAPSGKYVAVLDNRLADPGSDAPKVQDHHNGWLDLSSGEVTGNLVKVKGKYFLPSSTEVPATGLRFTIRKRCPDGLRVYSDKTLELDQVTDQWADFSIELPINAEQDPAPGNYALLLSAVPFAGPIYLDNVQVTDPQGNELWAFPEFEMD